MILTSEDIRAIAISRVLKEQGINPDVVWFHTSNNEHFTVQQHDAIAQAICRRIDELTQEYECVKLRE